MHSANVTDSRFSAVRLLSIWRMERTHFWFAGRQALVESLIRQNLSRQSAILDVGCGTGWMVESLTRDGYRVAGMDRDDEGRPVRLNGLIWDISERRYMEEELRKSRDDLELRVGERTAELSATVARLELVNAELQEFAFVAPHDLQEPLRKIQTFCDMAKKRCAPVLDITS